MHLQLGINDTRKGDRRCTLCSFDIHVPCLICVIQKLIGVVMCVSVLKKILLVR